MSARPTIKRSRAPYTPPHLRQASGHAQISPEHRQHTSASLDLPARLETLELGQCQVHLVPRPLGAPELKRCKALLVHICLRRI